MIKNIQHTQFVENVLGIPLTLEQSCNLFEGIVPKSLNEQILLETRIYEGFLDDLAAKIGSIPKDIAKTFTDATSVLKFIYNVIADKTGENLKKANTILKRNMMGLYAKVERLLDSLPETIKKYFSDAINWIKTKAQSILSTTSDVDSQDNIKGDGGNWKRFIVMFLVGCLLVFLKSIPQLLKGFKEGTVNNGLEQLLTMTQNLVSKFLTSPQELLKVVAGGSLIKALLPLLTIYKSTKMLQTVNDELLDSNSWLRKT